MKKLTFIAVLALATLSTSQVKGSETSQFPPRFVSQKTLEKESLSDTEVQAILTAVQPAYDDMFGLSVSDLVSLYGDLQLTIQELPYDPANGPGRTFRVSYGGLVVVDNVDI